MRVAILAPSKSVVGGVERFCRYLQDAFNDAGHETVIISFSPTIISQIFSYLGLGAPYSGWTVGKLALKSEYDVIITNGLLGWNIPKKIPQLNVQHGTYAASADRIDAGMKWFVKKWIWGRFEALTAKHASTVVAVSRDTANSAKKYYSVENVEVIPNAVSPEFEPKDKEESRRIMSLPKGKLALFVGRFEFAKGADIIERCLPILEKYGYKLITASDRMVDIAEMSLIDVAYDQMPYLYSACDLFLFPSRHEGCSYALLEALSCGLPTYSTRVGSALDILEARPELTLWFQGIDSFAAGLDGRLSGNKEQEESGLAMRVAQNFSLKAFRSRYLILLDRIYGKSS